MILKNQRWLELYPALSYLENKYLYEVLKNDILIDKTLLEQFGSFQTNDLIRLLWIDINIDPHSGIEWLVLKFVEGEIKLADKQKNEDFFINPDCYLKKISIFNWDEAMQELGSRTRFSK